MTGTDAQIVNLLKKGCSYAEIQEQLQVSSKTIAAARKAYFPGTESTTGVLSRDTFQLRQEPFPSVSAPKTVTKTIKTKPQKTQTMNKDHNYDDDDNVLSKLEVEKYRIKLAHELEMEKLLAAKEDKEREHSIREQEIELSRDTMERAKEKIEQEKRSLIFRIKKLVESCEDAEYSYGEAENMLETARKVLSDSEEFCFIHEITFHGTISYTLLNKVISTFTDFIEDMDEDDSDDLEFDSSFRRQVSRATFQTF